MLEHALKVLRTLLVQELCYIKDNGRELWRAYLPCTCFDIVAEFDAYLVECGSR
jgi:hypothetical protein